MKNLMLIVLYLVILDAYFTYVISSDIFDNYAMLGMSLILVLITIGFVKILIKINKKW